MATVLSMHFNDLSEAICTISPRPFISTLCAAMHVLEKSGTFALLRQYIAASRASETAQVLQAYTDYLHTAFGIVLHRSVHWTPCRLLIWLITTANGARWKPPAASAASAAAAAHSSKHGFEIVHECVLQPGCPSLFFMQRAPADSYATCNLSCDVCRAFYSDEIANGVHYLFFLYLDYPQIRIYLCNGSNDWLLNLIVAVLSVLVNFFFFFFRTHDFLFQLSFSAGLYCLRLFH